MTLAPGKEIVVSRGELIEQRLPFAPRAKRLWPASGSLRLGR